MEEDSDESVGGSDHDDFIMDEFDDLGESDVSQINIKLCQDKISECEYKSRKTAFQAYIFKACNIITSLLLAGFGIAITILATGYAPSLAISILVGVATFVNFLRDILRIGTIGVDLYYASISYKKMRRRLLKAILTQNNLVISETLADVSEDMDSLGLKIFTKGYGPKQSLNVAEKNV